MEQFKIRGDAYRIKRYYSIKINDGGGYIASKVDKFIFRFLIFLTLYIYLYMKLKSSIVSLFVSIIFIIAYSALAYKINQKKLNENIKIIDKKLIKEKVYTNLMNKSKDSYIDYVKEIMVHYGIEDMKKIIRKDLDIIGIIGEEKVGIKCYQYSEEHKVDRNDMKNFFIEIRDKNINKGIIITTSYFSEESQDFFSNMETIDITFLTIEEIIEIVKGTALYPEKRDIERMILKKLNDNRVNVKSEGKKIISKDNTKSCIITGLVMILFSRFTEFKIYYNMFGIILIALGLIPILRFLVNLIIGEKLGN